MVEESPRNAEEEKVFLNRREMFESLGFTKLQSTLLAKRNDIHYYDAKGLLDSGCSADLVMRILM